MPVDLSKVDVTKVDATVVDPTEPAWLATPEDFAAFVYRFHACQLPAADFTHAAHVAVAAHALTHSAALTHDSAFTHGLALDRLRTAIHRFNESVGGHNTDTAGYHETLTRLWCHLIARTLATARTAPATDFDAARIAVRALGHRRDLYRDYYSFDVLASTEARHTWLPPDRLGPLGPID